MATQVLTQPAMAFTTTSTKTITKPYYLSLAQVLPTSFADMYALDTPCQLNSLGRPYFTQRDIVDWEINDLRSLLIVECIREEWHGELPVIAEDGFQLTLLPLDADDQTLVQTLVHSGLYKEHHLDYEFLLQTAQYTVGSARARQHLSFAQQGCASYTSLPFTKPEWRNIIENYLLNLACEAQCRLDFKKACAQLKKKRAQEVPSSQKPKSLLKQALLTASAHHGDAPTQLKLYGAANVLAGKNKHHLSRREKQEIWVSIQAHLYKRLGLDWEPDVLD